LTYFVTTSFAGAAGALLQIAPLIVYYVKIFILGSNPRAVYNIKYSMNGVAWGTLVRTLVPLMRCWSLINLSYCISGPI
jgi:hypothetical protein